MRFLYTTDLHGNKSKFSKILEIAKKQKIKILHLGADILPKSPFSEQKQKYFIENFFKEWLEKCKREEIKILVHFGNDDLYVLKALCRKYNSLLDEISETIDTFIFTAYSWVPDHPFGLKTACKLDYRGWKRPKYKQGVIPVDYAGKWLFPILEIEDYFKNKTTIEEDLKKLKLTKKDKCIISVHCPPYGLNLDVCSDGRRVGSKSIYDWIVREQPLLVLCGHIHESFKTSGIWKGKIGNTLVIQPGQTSTLDFVEIEITNNVVNSKLYTI